MPPNLRVGVATILLVLVAAYYQLFAFKITADQNKHGTVLAPMIAETRDAVARSAHPELYSSASKYDFFLIGNYHPSVTPFIRAGVHYALAPALVTLDSSSERIVVLFETPDDITRFEAANRVRLLDQLGALVRVYQVESKRP